jgi:hypothetical protein
MTYGAVAFFAQRLHAQSASLLQLGVGRGNSAQDCISFKARFAFNMSALVLT